MKTKIKKILTIVWFVSVTFGVLYSQDGVRVPLNRFFETGKFKLSETATPDTLQYNSMLTILGDTCLVMVNPEKNLNRTTWAELIDTSCLRMRWTNPTGKLSIMWSNPAGVQYGIDTTGKFTAPGDIFAGNDIFTLNNRYIIAGSNSSGTQGIALNATSDGVARLRNAGISSDASLQIAKLITSNVTAPTTASSTGTQGEIRIGSDGYIYICTATNTWLRAQCVTW